MPGISGLCVLVYADDIVLFSPSKAQAQADIDALEIALASIGLHICTKKTKVMSFVNPTNPLDTGDSVNGHGSRSTRTGRHRDIYGTQARHTRLDNPTSNLPTLLMPWGPGPLACPFTACPFVTNATDPQTQMQRHVRHYHRIPTRRHTQYFAPRPALIEEQRRLRPGASWKATPAPQGPSGISLRGVVLTQEDNFRYLGCYIEASGSTAINNSWRAQQAQKAFGSIDPALWHSPHLPLAFKRQLFRTLVEPALFYAADSWTSSANASDLIASTYLRIVRKITQTTTTCTETSEGRVFHTPSPHVALAALGVPSCADIRRQHRLRLLGQSIRAPPGCLLHLLTAPPSLVHHLRGNQPSTWLLHATADATALHLTPSHAVDQEHWARTIKARFIPHVAPSTALSETHTPSAQEATPVVSNSLQPLASPASSSPL
jgi:hypothetical protein